ncbi:glucose-induced degradation protein 8 [Nematocida homosporus]|uniref:glucose-induced degradation protein 8 n=1 Tax=Nematocida homosporus TaxID=1912981 RepID=UPI0022201050|nr:glucose-induced degradation protein 8 [Nematocida homosporus]KAI5186488.1 glucose-induced degradation protein 8 [Nematocida homosporus]
MQVESFQPSEEVVNEVDAESTHIEEKLLGLSISQESIQKVILEFLSEQGYSKAARAFKRETGISIEMVPVLPEREEIRLLAEKGEFLGVLEKTSAISPFIFSDDPALYFAILRQDLLEDVEVRGQTEGHVLLRMEKEVAPVVEKHPSLLSMMESLVSEIVFRTRSLEKVLEGRHEVFQEINRKVLRLFDYEINDGLSKFLEETEEVASTTQFISLAKECPLIDVLVQKVKKQLR